MPKRTNEFQNLVAYIYSRITPIGGKVTESAEFVEDGSSTKREIDILIEYEVAGIEIKIAVECRDRSRPESVKWIEDLIAPIHVQASIRLLQYHRLGFPKKQ